MAHNLATIDGGIAMAFTGSRKDIWHSLGTEVSQAMTQSEAIEKGRLDWLAVKVQNYARNPKGAVVPVDSYSVFRSTDNQLLASSVGKGFTLVQNKEAFSFVDSLVNAENGAHYDTVGALGLGETIFMSIRLPHLDYDVVKGDKMEAYLVFTTSHDGTGASTAFISHVRPVCQNTLRQGLSSQSGILRIKHTKNQDVRFDAAKRTMTGVTMDVTKMREKLQLLASRKMTRESMTAVFDRLFPVKEDQNKTRRENVISDIVTLYESNDQNAFPEMKGTGYNLLNAVTEYTDHFRTPRMTSGRDGMTVERVRAENAVSGSGEKLKSLALETILAMTGEEQTGLLDSLYGKDIPVLDSQAATAGI